MAGMSGLFGHAIQCFLPWIMFTSVALVYTFGYHSAPTACVLLIVLYAAACCCLLAAEAQVRAGQGKKFYLMLGIVCGASVLAGWGVGWYNYQTNMISYWTYDENRVYTNVLAGEPASTMTDASVLIFSSDTTVDTTKSVGYRAGSIYCVAPILSTQPSSKVSYWAAGTNCCKQRGGFTCGDVDQKWVHGGAVIMQPFSSLLPSSMSDYAAAAKEAAAEADGGVPLDVSDKIVDN